MSACVYKGYAFMTYRARSICDAFTRVTQTNMFKTIIRSKDKGHLDNFESDKKRIALFIHLMIHIYLHVYVDLNSLKNIRFKY